MSKRSDIRPSLAEICKTPRLTLHDLAITSGISRSAISGLENNPPNKLNTWQVDWRPRISTWIPLFGHAFQEVLECQALAQCPPEVLQELRHDYTDWAAGAQSDVVQLAPKLVETRRAQLLAEVHEHTYRLDWHTAEKAAARVTRLFAKHDSRWLFHRALEASCRVYRGDLDGAEAAVGRTIAEHELACAQAGQQVDLPSRTHAELVRSWSSFGRGDWQTARPGFEQAAEVGRLANDHELLNTGLHMRARIDLEFAALQAAFSTTARPAISHRLIQRVQDLEEAQQVVAIGSVECAYGNWFLGRIISVLGDPAAGNRILQKSASMLRSNGLTVAAVRHAEVAQLQNTLHTTSWDAETYKRIEAKLSEMLLQFEQDQSPYASGIATLTLAWTRLLREPNPNALAERKTTANFICLALLAHPYPQHPLWQMGLHLLRNRVLPTFLEQERWSFGQTLVDCVANNEPPFHFLNRWGCNVQRRGQITSILQQEFQNNSFE